MKSIIYRIRGNVTEDMIPAITATCDSLAGVTEAAVSVQNSASAILRLTLAGEPSDTLEADLRAIMTAKGLELGDLLPEEAPSEEQPTVPAPDAPKHYVTGPEPKKGRTVGLTAAVATVITAVILAVLLTFSLTTAYMKGRLPTVVQPGSGTTAENPLDELDVIDRLFRSLTMQGELDDEAIVTAVLKAYVAATGDAYAEYFTADELENLTGEQNGEMCGIGVSVVSAPITVDGRELQALIIANVYAESPAERAGVIPGDAIMYVGKGENKAFVNDIGYTEALNRLRGEEGTECAFTVYRRPQGSDASVPYTPVEITAIREKMTTLSVVHRLYEPDPSVGIIRITGFDNTTRDQFVEAVEALKAQGCTSFVLDLRGNPGGLLTSVLDVLTYFLEENDTLISTKNNQDVESVTKLTVANGKVTCGSGTIPAEDIGKYRDLNFAVMVNEYSASAAELFTANIRDYDLAPIVGTKTYGKGSMQTTFSLSRYGYDGALKLTTAHYFPPSGEGYDGIGITPDVVVALSEEASRYNINLLPDALDNQLTAAIAALK